MISVITVTGRKEAALDRMSECLKRQTIKNFEWVIVDRIARKREPDYYTKLEQSVSFPINAVEPKWSIYHDFNMPAIANARNSGLIAAKRELVVWIDDNMWFPDNYLETHLNAYKAAAGKPYYMVGVTWPFIAWDEVKELAEKEPYDKTGKFCRVGTWAENEAVRSYDDHRLYMPYTWPDGGEGGSYGSYERIKGSWCYCGNLSVPLEYALAVNGFEEECDGAPEGEDLDFGLRLDNFGCMGLFDRKCVVYKYRNPSFPTLQKLYPYTRGYIGEVNGLKIQRCEFRMWAIMKEKHRIKANANMNLVELNERLR